MALGRQALLVALAASWACGPDAPPGPPFSALVIDIDQVVDGQPSFVFAERQLETVTDFDALDSPLFRVLRGGTLTAREVAGSVVVDPEFSGADEPDLRYRVEGGVAIPLDYSTLAMISAAYQLERVMLSLEQAIGVPAGEIVASGRYELLFEPTLRSEGDITATVTPKFNAFYLPGGVRQLGLARRSQFEELPIAVSPLVVAHEFGHGLFEIGFDGGNTPSCDEDAANDEVFFPGRFQLEHAISGLNEGWADFVSFAILGTFDPLAGVGFDDDSRDLATTRFGFSDVGCVGEFCDCSGSFYCIGTVFARSLFQAFVAGGGDPADPAARGAFAAEIFAALGATQAAMRERADLPPAGPALRACEVPEFDDFDEAVDGPVSSAFLGALVASLAPELRGDVCAALIANFGDAGFAPEARDGCP